MSSMILLTVLQLFNFLLSFLLIIVNANIPKCRIKGSQLVGETCFRFYASRLSWHDAKSDCDNKGMILAYVTSFNQSKDIFKNITIDGEAWIGASDELKEGEFIWAASNEPAAELNQYWRKGEPNNKKTDFGDEDCASILPNFYANDSPCNNSYPYLCMEQSCPHSLMVRQVFSQKVTLSWKPGFNGGQAQNFTVRYQDLITNVSRVVNTGKVSRAQQMSSRPFEYSVSGLSTKTPYQIDVEAITNKGRIPCTMSVTAKTTGPPECPVNVTIQGVANDRFSLSWTPGQDDELPQTVHILAHNVCVLKNIVIPNVTVGSVFTNSYTCVRYTVANLSDSTHHTFSFDVENKFGSRKCNDDYIHVTTASGVQNSSLSLGLIFVFIFVPLMLAATVAGCVYYRSKAKRTLVTETPNAYDSLTNDIQLIDGGQGTDFVYTAPIGLSAVPASDQDTKGHDYEPMKSEHGYANSSDMMRIVSLKSPGTDDTSIYSNM